MNEYSLQGARLSPWIVIDGYCATRVLEGSDPDKIENRVAFIEKSPRVRVKADVWANDAWRYGFKGAGGGDPEQDQTYGFYPASREWCDAQLREMGAILPEDQ